MNLITRHDNLNNIVFIKGFSPIQSSAYLDTKQNAGEAILAQYFFCLLPKVYDLHKVKIIMEKPQLMEIMILCT